MYLKGSFEWKSQHFISLSSTEESNQRNVQLSPKNSPVYEKKEPTVIEIGSDQWNILEAYLGSCQGSKIERFTKFVSELKNLNGFAKNSILYVLPEAKYFNLLYKFNLL